VRVDFAARTGELTSTEFARPATTANFGGTGLIGQFQFAAGQNRITGTVSSRDTTGALTGLTGPLSGQFFGPSAQEIGGLFDLTPAVGSSSPERLIGAFGS
jgi:hypothetical protein